MDLSWPFPPEIRMNSCSPKDWFLGEAKKMHLPLASDLCNLIWQAGKGSYLYATVARAYHQPPLDPGDWPLIGFQFEGRYYTNISFPFRLRWVASHCQDVTNCIARELRRQGLALLNYIEDVGVEESRATADYRFSQLQGLLAKLGVQDACHKSPPPPPLPRHGLVGGAF